MNICIISGKLQQKPILLGEGKAMKFTLLTQYRQESADQKERFAAVPCTVFNPSEALKQFLSSEQVTHCKGVGRVSRSRYEDKDGNMVYATEVILNPNSIMVRTG